jgi:hypothetical protein
MGVASKLGKKLTKSKKLQSLEKEYGRRAQPGESAREFQSRMNQLESVSEGSAPSSKGSQSMVKMFEGMTLKQRRSEIRELQADGIGVPKKILDMAGMEKVGGKLKVKSGMMGGGAAMKKKMMMGGGASMKKKAYAKGGANMKKKSYAAGGASMKKKSYAVGGMVRANAGASVPASGGSRNK